MQNKHWWKKRKLTQTSRKLRLNVTQLHLCETDSYTYNNWVPLQQQMIEKELLLIWCSESQILWQYNTMFRLDNSFIWYPNTNYGYENIINIRYDIVTEWKQKMTYFSNVIFRCCEEYTVKPLISTHQIPKLVSRLFLRLSLPNPLTPGVKSRMKM